MKELQNKSYEELVQLQQDGKITLVEFVEAVQAPHSFCFVILSSS